MHDFYFRAFISAWGKMVFSEDPEIESGVVWVIDGDGVAILTQEESEFGDGYEEVEGVGFMQYTGIKCDKGNKIYCSDIVKRSYVAPTTEMEITGVVKMLEGMWVIDDGSNAVKLWTECDNTEVVGNIYEGYRCIS